MMTVGRDSLVAGWVVIDVGGVCELLAASNAMRPVASYMDASLKVNASQRNSVD